jgi:hypothetical protein
VTSPPCPWIQPTFDQRFRSRRMHGSMHRGGGCNFRSVGSLVRSPGLSMIGGTSYFLLEACPTCHKVRMMHVLHLSHRFASHVVPWIHVLSSPAIERKHTCDPRMEIDFGDLVMDHGGLQWLISSIGRSPDLHMGPN